jgi:hypothetical protein
VGDHDEDDGAEDRDEGGADLVLLEEEGLGALDDAVVDVDHVGDLLLLRLAAVAVAAATATGAVAAVRLALLAAHEGLGHAAVARADAADLELDARDEEEEVEGERDAGEAAEDDEGMEGGVCLEGRGGGGGGGARVARDGRLLVGLGSGVCAGRVRWAQ